MRKSRGPSIYFCTWSITIISPVSYLQRTGFSKLQETFDSEIQQIPSEAESGSLLDYLKKLLKFEYLSLKRCIEKIIVSERWSVKKKLTFSLAQGGTSILGGRRAWTSHQVWKQNLGQGPAKFTK